MTTAMPGGTEAEQTPRERRRGDRAAAADVLILPGDWQRLRSQADPNVLPTLDSGRRLHLSGGMAALARTG